MLTTAKLAEVRKLQAYCAALILAHDVLAEAPPEDRPELKADLVAWRTSQRNRILAGSGEKAELFGTLSTEPLVTAKSLTDLDVYPSTAEAMIAARDEIRAALLAAEAPKVVVKP